jgi:hypothetical protein
LFSSLECKTTKTRKKNRNVEREREREREREIERGREGERERGINGWMDEHACMYCAVILMLYLRHV